ncbi:MAG: winged helix DNA-binding domain-containing protein [Herpetosiphonaceae bacterium]|nr:winged helix DNA-binding domain-containing protein [Herpetosiphonaceae bacterium]
MMTTVDITHRRLLNQHLAGTPFAEPTEVVQWLGAVQAQDYAAAKWAVGQRVQGATDAMIEQACSEGAILRTHVMRPTWHFVTPTDIRWLLALTAPRVNAFNGSWYRKLELDDAVFRQSNSVLMKALQGAKQLTRPELLVGLQQAGIAAADPLRFTHIMMRAELDGLVCSGAWRGKQPTYALLEERVPPAPMLQREEALAELARRYFTSHGPATLQDYSWWSGLTVADTKAGLEMVKSQLSQELVDGKHYWFVAAPVPTEKTPEAYLLPNYDEYIVAYTDRSAVFDAAHTPKLDARGNILFNNIMVLDGRIIGTWQRTFKHNMVIINANPFVSLSAAEQQAFASAAERYGRFLGLMTMLQI